MEDGECVKVEANIATFGNPMDNIQQPALGGQGCGWEDVFPSVGINGVDFTGSFLVVEVLFGVVIIKVVIKVIIFSH